MELTKIKIGLLEVKSNCSTWKYKVCTLLRGIVEAMEVVQGTLTEPKALEAGASAGDVAIYNEELNDFRKTKSSAIITYIYDQHDGRNSKKYHEVFRAREIWKELHRLFDGLSEDKA
ncbi:hypothetical protein JTB14_004393 [Gonioctena quinquepunctata]|nr:hypothetical protein JTB14_004393 [Gonioctena quinquepunctata]